ncbi:hypothetical protein CTAYLR_007141 [Chrysophaeum taylorii]|uniref:Uncharacterized protein n=1 Tax=Chrysophaeum taylorii TaxID=2483200 RepID=A0AAD7ULR6_9STRA|nr:hypothetical protein CTAYLR_007141 [Chrysophaeum taylorii]
MVDLAVCCGGRARVAYRDTSSRAIALVDDTLGLIAIAVVEAMHSTKPHGDYKILYVHAFVVRADLRKRPQARNQSPIFAADDSTPPMGYSIRHALRAQNWTDLCARLLRASTNSGDSCVSSALRDKFPIHHFKAETRIEDVMNSVVEARVDSRGRTLAAAAKQRASEGISQTDPRRPVSREPGPNDEVRPERPHGVFVYVVDGRRARLLTEVCSHSSPCKTFSPHLQMLARLQEMGGVVEKTITGDDCYVDPDGIAYPSVVEAAAAVGAPQTVAGLFIVLAHYTLVPRANELELLPLAREKGEFFACSAYLIETYSNNGRRGLCSNGAHISCLNNYYMRSNLIPGVRPVGAMFCSVLCQDRGVALKLRIVHHPDDPDILFVPQIEFPGALPAAMLLATQITRPMRLADRRDLRSRLQSLGLSCDGLDALETPWSDYESKRHATHLLDAASLTWSAVSNEHADRIPVGLPPLPPPSLLPPPPAF